MAGVQKIKSRKMHKKEFVMDDKNKKSKGEGKSRKICMSLTKVEEKKMNEATAREDKMSILIMIFILVVCFVGGISLGYLLYRIAINGGM